MSQTKYKLPDYLKALCIGYVRGYEKLVILYHKRRNDVIYSLPDKYDTYLLSDGTDARAYTESGGGKSNPVHKKYEELEKIENLPDTLIMRAVEKAKLTIGEDMADEPRRLLAGAVWDSCLYGKNFSLPHYPLSVGKDNFYERRRRFLYHIAKNMHHL